MEYLDNIGKRAQAAKPDLQHLKSEEKNQILRKSADDLKLHATEILAANEKDMEKGRTNGMSQGLLDRLLLTEDRIAQIAEGLYQIAALDDPIGEVLGMKPVSYTHLDVYKRQTEDRSSQKRWDRKHMWIRSGKI